MMASSSLHIAEATWSCPSHLQSGSTQLRPVRKRRAVLFGVLHLVPRQHSPRANGVGRGESRRQRSAGPEAVKVLLVGRSSRQKRRRRLDVEAERRELLSSEGKAVLSRHQRGAPSGA